MKRGICAVCGVANQSGRDFICEDCGDPNGVRMFCEKCKKRTSLDASALATVERQMCRAIPQRSGVVLKNSCCEECTPGNAEVQTRIFLLKIN